MHWLDQYFWGNTLRDWGYGLSITLVSLFIVWLVKRIILARLLSLTRKTKNNYDDLVANILTQTKVFLFAIVAIYFGALSLELSETGRLWINRAAMLAVLLQVAIWGNAFITYALQEYQEENLEKDAGNVTTLRALSFVAKLVLFSVVILLALDNFGVEITTLLTGLGVGSVAVALAVQNILADLFASLSIALDKPFVIGDLIIVDDYVGTVEKLGLKTTRIRSLSGEQLIFANNDLLNSRIRNYKRMGERRVDFSFGVTYQTPAEKLKAIPAWVEEVITKIPKVRFDRAHFNEFGDSALNFEVVYYILSAEYIDYMDAQQAINFALHERFEQEGVEFAYPTQTLFVNQEEA